MLRFLHSISNNLGFGFPCCAYQCNAFGVEGDCTKSDSDHLAFTHRFDATEVTSCSCLRSIVQLAEPGCAEVITALAVESNVPVWANATHEESNATQGSNSGLVSSAPLVYATKCQLLHSFQASGRFTITQSQVYMAIRPNVLKLFCDDVVFWLPSGPIASWRCNANGATINEHSLVWVQAKAFDVELCDIMVEAVVLLRRYRVELINLHEGQPRQRGVRRLQTMSLHLLLHFRSGPLIKDFSYPLDEVLWSLAGGQ
mmetsp:Transcript_724/g.2188  ORF Transcript_724/g.2188 Transcript_724/m.2188 type:complete len:257 (-) Transcript_724:31-801(-)